MNQCGIVIIIIICAFIIVTYIYWGGNNIDKGKFSQYIISLSIIGILVSLCTFFVNSTHNNKLLKKNDINTTVHNLEDSYLELEKIFMDYYPYSTDLYKQLYDNCKHINNVYINENNMDINKKKMINSHISSIIFQKIENTLICLDNIRSDNHKLYQQMYNKWHKIWEQWFKSSILKDEWYTKKILYSQKTQYLINQLIY